MKFSVQSTHEDVTDKVGMWMMMYECADQEGQAWCLKELHLAVDSTASEDRGMINYIIRFLIFIIIMDKWLLRKLLNSEPQCNVR